MRAEADEPSIRGSYISPSKAWIARTYGPEVFENALRVLAPEQRAIFGAELVGMSWYPLRYWTAILDEVRAQVHKKTGEDGPTFDRRHLFESISGTMRTMYRIAFGFFAPTTIVAKVTPYFKRVYSHGDYEVIRNDLGLCVLRFKDAPVEMLPELERSFPLAASWMLDIANQTVTRRTLVPKVSGEMFSCDLTLEYRTKNQTRQNDTG
jgi:hypothetical protein